MKTIGCDPELFFKNDTKFISVIGFLGGSKENPFSIGNGCAIQEDNVAAEFCVPPAQNVEQFIKSINYALSNLATRAADLGLSLAANSASHVFDKDQLDHPDAQRFGCDPDYNAWTRRVNPRPRATDAQLRSAGGHVHIGTDKDHNEVIKACDLFLGVPSVEIDTDTRRRELYGKAGACRYKSYGPEYRTLSNFWIWNDERIKWVYHQTEKAEAFAETYSFTKEDEEIITSCINKGDKTLIVDIQKKFPQVFEHHVL